jgi:hypothetical protein
MPWAEVRPWNTGSNTSELYDFGQVTHLSVPQFLICQSKGSDHIGTGCQEGWVAALSVLSPPRLMGHFFSLWVPAWWGTRSQTESCSLLVKLLMLPWIPRL